MGMLIWQEYPDIWNLAGIAIIVAAGLLVWRVEAGPRRTGRQGLRP